MNLERFHITEFANPSGATVYRVDGKDKNGKRVRQNFKTLLEAKSEKARLEGEVENIEMIPHRPTRLSQGDLAQAESAFLELRGFPLSLLETVKWVKANYTDPEKKITVGDAVPRFLADKKAANLRPATLRTLNQRVGRIAETFPARLVSDIGTEQLRSILFRAGSGIVNQESDYRAFKNFFNWSVAQSYCKANPMDKIPRIKLDREEPVIMPLSRVRALLSAATEYKEGVCLPYVVLGLFCAIRPTELARLTWDDIDLAAGTVTIGAKIAKMRARRIVTIPANAQKFLRSHVLKKTPLVGKNWRKDFDRIKAAVGYGTPTEENPQLEPWTMDVLRHTGISHHLAEHQHEGQTAVWAGNSPDVIQKHYKGLVKKAESKDFWSISPADAARKIVKLKAA